MAVMRVISVATVVAADTYDESKAFTYANLATAAYCSTPHLASNSLLQQWKCGPACDAVSGMSEVFTINGPSDQDAFVFGGKLNGECTIVFRGTSDMAGWMQDLKSLTLVDIQGVKCSYNGKTCKVGEGFMTNYNVLAPHIVGNLSSIGCTQETPLAVIGHSLGAAEAAIGMFDLKGQGFDIATSYTFGQPRTGDSTFVAAFQEAFGKTGQYRLTHKDDPVPQLPGYSAGGFNHVSTEVFYASDVSKGYKVCDESGEDATCAKKNAGHLIPAGLACLSGGKNCDHLTYMAPTKTTLMDGGSCATEATIV